MTTILAAAQETGAANALAPVIKELDRRVGVNVVVAAAGNAARVFVSEGIKHQRVGLPGKHDGREMDGIRELLAGTSPHLLLLGTAWGQSLDKLLLRVASGDVPSISIVDTWSYFAERFTDPRTGERVFPTRVAVADEWALEEAVQHGFPRHLLVATGQPHLDMLPARVQDPEISQQAQRLRRNWLRTASVENSRRIVLFASEAFTRHAGPSTPYYRGYTEIDGLEGLVEAVQCVEKTTNLRIEVVLKLHPEESPNFFCPGPRAIQRGVRVVADQPSLPCILAADVIVGMVSMFLIEASVALKPAISFQPGLHGRDGFVGSRIGLMPVASSVQELTQLLDEYLTNAGTTRRNPPFTRGDAASRIADMALELTSFC